jgi:flagellar basal body-associated protein FliL/outer membrane lipoprotein-sorting protein
MAEFKFSCPQCGQHIQCDPGYSGAQINCPSCQQAIVVPQAPRFTAAPTAPPVPPSAPPGLTTRQSTTVPATGRRFAGAPGAQPPAKPESKALRNVLIITAAVVVLAGLGAGAWFGIPKYKQHKAAQEAKKGNPAAQVPTPTATAATGALDVLSKVHQAYTNLTSLSVSGTSMMVIDMSQVTAADLNPNQPANNKNATRRPANIPKAITNKTEVAIKLARPDLYRIEGTSKTAAGRMSMTNTTATWSSGKTNYTLMLVGGGAYKNFTTVPDRKSALMTSAQSGGLAMAIPQLFFDETEVMGNFIKDWGQTDDESLNGQDCYTLTAKMLGQKLKIWVSKTSYMILQSQITLGGPVSDADINAAFDTFNTTTVDPAQIAQQKAQAKQQAAMITKIRGTVTETYDTIEANKTFVTDDFNYPVPRGVRLTPSPFGAAATSTSSTSSSREVSQRNACINNLRQIDAAINEWSLEKGKANGTVVTEADIKPYIKLDASGNLPKCPAGGTYTLGKVGGHPTCTILGHVLP